MPPKDVDSIVLKIALPNLLHPVRAANTNLLAQRDLSTLGWDPQYTAALEGHQRDNQEVEPFSLQIPR